MNDFFSTKYFPWQNLVWFLSVVHKITVNDMLYFRKLQDVFMFVFFFHSICQEGKKNASVFYFFSTSEI